MYILLTGWVVNSEKSSLKFKVEYYFFEHTYCLTNAYNIHLYIASKFYELMVLTTCKNLKVLFRFFLFFMP